MFINSLNFTGRSSGFFWKVMSVQIFVSFVLFHLSIQDVLRYELFQIISTYLSSLSKYYISGKYLPTTCNVKALGKYVPHYYFIVKCLHFNMFYLLKHHCPIEVSVKMETPALHNWVASSQMQLLRTWNVPSAVKGINF